MITIRQRIVNSSSDSTNNININNNKYDDQTFPPKQKKTQLVNWRFCHSLSIFCDFIGKMKDEENVGKLVHIVSDIITGTIK